ncbi:MAG: FKBP-type peptidyl-prolyl cis-trans isomerase, partial [Pseudomonadota bacterium]
MSMFRSRAAVFVAASSLLAACGGSEETAEPAADAASGAAGFTFDEAVYPAPGLDERSEAFLDANGVRDGVMTTESGLQYEVIERGPGGGAEGGWPEDETLLLRLDYAGYFVDGLQFDGTENGEPLDVEFDFLFDGLKQGLKLMHEGDRYRFFIPASLAFGERGTPNGPVRPNEALVYEVRLVDVVTAEEAAEEEAAIEAAAAAEEQELVDALAAAEAFLAEKREGEDVIATDSGLLYKVVEEGPADAPSPTAEDTVRVHYRGTLPDGTQFDSSYDRGEPATFPLGGVIAGWTEGVQLMSVGDKFEFYIPPQLGYGESGAGADIGPNAALVFEVELLAVNPGAENE